MRKLGKNVKRALYAINYGASIYTVVNSKKGKVSIRRLKKAYLARGYKLVVKNNILIFDRIRQ